MGLTDKELNRTADAMKKADSLMAAKELLRIGYTTLKYRISRSPMLQKIHDEKFARPGRKAAAAAPGDKKIPPGSQKGAPPEIPEKVQKPDLKGKEIGVLLETDPGVNITINILGVDLGRVQKMLQILQGEEVAQS